MTMPTWDDARLGSMSRAGLWLIAEIGEGNTFTKTQLRAAFPGVAQIDRRVRELRKYGWVIDTRTQDVGLAFEEQRLVTVGGAVWERGVRADFATAEIGAAARMRAFEADNFQCVICGIAGGEKYADAPLVTAVLFATPATTLGGGAQPESMRLVTECVRCRQASPVNSGDHSQLLEEISALSRVDRGKLVECVERGTWATTPLERAWSSYRRLPYGQRALVRKDLRGSPA